MADCPNCGREIQGGMRFCPNCGQDQSVVVPQGQRIPTEDVPVPPPPGPPRGGGRRKWVIGLLGGGGLLALFLVVLLVAAVVSGPTNQTAQSEGDEEQKSEKKPTPNKKSGPENVTAAVGESAQLADRTLVVNEAEGYAPPNQFQRPQPGNEYLRVYVTLRNTGNQPFDYNPLDFKVQDSNGVQKNSEFITEMPYSLEYGSLAPDGTVEGNLVFEIPQGDNDLHLIYETNPIERRTITVGPL